MSATTWEPLGSAASELVVAAAQKQLRDPVELFESAEQSLLGALPVLAADADLASLAQATSRANITRWLVNMTRHPGGPVGRDLTPESLEIGRDIVRRGLDQDVLWTGYRRGQNATWIGWMRTVCTLSTTRPEWTACLSEALDATAHSWFSFIDDILINVEAQISLERDHLRGGGTPLRLETVQLILEGAPITPTRASKRLGYDLKPQHLGYVLWTDGEVGQGSLEKTAIQLARTAEIGRPLILPVSARSLWAWAHAPAPPNMQAMREAVAELRLPINVAVGTRTSGMTGFGVTHRQALDARRLAQRLTPSARFTSYEDIEVVVLTGTDPDRANHFIRQTLGNLMNERPEIRNTMLTYLRHERNATNTAHVLFTHRNTVLNRLARAEKLLPTPSAERPLAVHLALELDHWLATQPGAPGN